MSPLAMTTTVLDLRAGVLDLRAGVPGAEPRVDVAFSIPLHCQMGSVTAQANCYTRRRNPIDPNSTTSICCGFVVQRVLQ